MFLQQIRLDISPDPGVDLCGFANRPQPSDRLLDPLYCRALLLESSGSSVLLIQLDLIGLSSADSLNMRKKLAGLLTLSLSQVQIFCSHTHSGPCTLPLLGCGSFNAEYTAWLTREFPSQMVEGIHSSLKIKVYPTWNKVRAELGTHRRGAAKDPESSFIRILSLQNQQQDYVAMILNYAMHPVGFKSSYISADYPGYLLKMLEQELPGDPLCLFSLGPCGDVDPPVVDTDQQHVRQWAEQLGRAILKQVRNDSGDTMEEIVGPCQPVKIECSQQMLKWPVEAANTKGVDHWRNYFLSNQEAVLEFGENYLDAIEDWHQNRMSDLRQRNEPPLEIELGKVMIGDITLYFVNAEVFSSVLSYVKDNQTMLITLANGAEGYLPDEEQYRIGGYEADLAFLFYDRFKPMPGALEALGNLFI